MPFISPAHLHVLVNHLPIIGMPLVALLLLWGIVRRQDLIIRVALCGTILMAGGSVLADLTGDGAKDNIEHETWANRDVIHEHEDAAEFANIAAIVTGAAALILLVMARGGKPMHRAGAMAVLLALAVTGAAMARTGWEGGKIRHSEFQATAPSIIQGTQDDD